MAKRVPLVQRRKARQLIMQALYQWIVSRGAPDEIGQQFHEDNPGKVDWEYFDAVFAGAAGRAVELGDQLEPLLDRRLDAVDPVERALLYLGCYELANRQDVPYRVVINECVALAKAYGATDGYKYINGVLDRLASMLRPAEQAEKR